MAMLSILRKTMPGDVKGILDAIVQILMVSFRRIFLYKESTSRPIMCNIPPDETIDIILITCTVATTVPLASPSMIFVICLT